jgi:hypothetical protein
LGIDVDAGEPTTKTGMRVIPPHNIVSVNFGCPLRVGYVGKELPAIIVNVSSSAVTLVSDD